MIISRQIYTTRRQNNKTLRAAAITLLSFIMLAIAISPAPAATTTTLADLDRGALALIVTFGTLLLAIIFEVWRVGQYHQEQSQSRSAFNLKHEHHN